MSWVEIKEEIRFKVHPSSCAFPTQLSGRRIVERAIEEGKGPLSTLKMGLFSFNSTKNIFSSHFVGHFLSIFFLDFSVIYFGFLGEFFWISQSNSINPANGTSLLIPLRTYFCHILSDISFLCLESSFVDGILVSTFCPR